MIKKILPLLFLFSVFVCAQKKTEKTFKFTSKEDTVSYSIGHSIGKNLIDPDVKLNVDALIQGIRDVADGKESLLTDDEMRSVLQSFNAEMRSVKQKEVNEVKEKNKKEGEKFLAANKKKKGVVTLPNGLQYKVIKNGKGPQPKATDKVKVNYRGTLIDGQEFDSSYKRGKPAEFPLNQVIKGWTEALQLMHVGSKWELYLPPDLAYGERGAGSMIGPDATLIFEIELLGIEK